MAAHDRLNVSAGLASLAVAAVLVALKLWGLAETGALSIAASMADSALDLLVSLTGLVAILYAARPADEDHAFGHSSAEDLAALSQSLLVAVSAVLILITALRRLAERGHVDLESEGRGIFVMIVASALTFALVVWQRRVATRTGNRVVAADSLHYLSDLLPNVGAIAALAASRWFGLPHVDSLVAVAAALILAFAALRIGQRAFDALMDRRADPSVIETVRKITGAWPGIRGFHDLKTRTAGSTIFIQIHIELDGSQTLSEAHAIGAGLRREILRVVPHAQVIIHKDPVGDMPAP